MKNNEIASLFREIAQLLQIKGESVFRIRAYERAAQNIESLTRDIAEYAHSNSLTEIPGIGKDLSAAIQAYLSNGSIPVLEELKKTVPEGVLELLRIPTIGPKTAKLLYEEKGIKSVPELEAAINKGALAGLEGIKEKTVENMLKGIALVKKGDERMTLAEAIQLSDEVIAGMRQIPGVKDISCAGSLRRQKDTVRDIDILLVSSAPQKVMDSFVHLPQADEVQAHGPTKSSIRTSSGVQIDCRVVDAKSFGAALVYFTGSKNFNIKLRQLAMKLGLKVNEYGVFKGSKSIAGRTEEEVFKALGMAYVEPEMREDTGEIELALQGKLPDLLERKDIKGDFHVHSTWSDGRHTIAEMVRAAQGAGYAYVAITDHSQSLKVARGLSIPALAQKMKEIEKVRKEFPSIKVLFGTEADIDNEGGIDYPDEVLAQFDVVIAAVHTGFRQSRQQLTRRVVNACRNRHVHIIAHPTARLWGEREAYDIDMEEVFTAAADTNTSLEINSYPRRLDLNDANARRAKEKGVMLAINTDSHAIDQLASMRLGVAVGRRAWLTKKDVLNCLPYEALMRRLRK